MALAKQGYSVTTVKLVAHNLDLLKAKFNGTEDVSALQGNALDLSAVPDNSFDLMLVPNKNRQLPRLTHRQKQ